MVPTNHSRQKKYSFKNIEKKSPDVEKKKKTQLKYPMHEQQFVTLIPVQQLHCVQESNYKQTIILSLALSVMLAFRTELG